MARPNYPLRNEDGARCISRDRRFNHAWYTSKRFLIYDNDDMQGMKKPVMRVDGPVRGLYFHRSLMPNI